MVFGQKLKVLNSDNKDTIGKGISRGAEWYKFHLRSTYQWEVVSTERHFIKTPYYVIVHGFRTEFESFMTSLERAPQEEQNGANVGFI